LEVEQVVMGLNGNEAVAYALKQVEPDVVAAYPITPQTIIVERFSEYVANGDVKTVFVPVESEHSAMSVCIGAEAAGGRAFTATNSQGLALMWEMLYIASGCRLPIVMAVVNRALSAPINIHCDHSDSMGARDSGWIQLYCENSQEAYDSVIQAWRIGEHPDVQLPVMVCLDGFVLSHTLERVMTLPDEEVKKFVGERVFMETLNHEGKVVPYRLDPENPITVGCLDLYDFYFEHKRQQVEAMKHALKVVEEVGAAYGKVSGRGYGLIEPYMTEDADAVLVGLGSTMGTVKEVVKKLRARGLKVGALKVRAFRPFPHREIVDVLEDVEAVGVLDRAVSFGLNGGPLYTEMKATLYDLDVKPLVSNYVYGLGGRDIPMHLIEPVFMDLLKNVEKGRVEEPVKFVGLRGE